jgi:phosphoribosyl-AMP cyclohydrolase
MIGVSSKTTGYTENILQKFNATSPRTIGVYLYLDKAEKIMDFYCNGILKRDRRMKIKSDHEWTPIVTFDQPDFQVILNPYMNSHSIKGSQDSSIYDLNNYLINNIEHTRTTIRETHLDGLVLKVVKFSTDLANHALKDAEISSHLIKPDVETKEFSHEQGQLKAILMKFKSQQDALAYLSKVYNKNFFYSRDVAKLFAKKDIEDLARRHSTSEDEANHLVESKTGLAHEEAV